MHLLELCKLGHQKAPKACLGRALIKYVFLKASHTEMCFLVRSNNFSGKCKVSYRNKDVHTILFKFGFRFG